ncbi:hint-domain-containing protein [Mariannaea sp. PMI_226]|nr:hint-domain-containing protein [Mariannaea sp. PMI_226]
MPSQLATLHLEPIPDKDALLVQVKPPTEPDNNRRPHVPCDIVLVIDVSGSMAAAAPVPGEDASENTGLSVLDLTKHAARTIIETMNENDRLGIVTFSSQVSVLQPLTPMNDANKEAARNNIKNMHPEDVTNLWHGIREGLKLFKGAESSSRIPAVLILTDGNPNYMCPPAGYVPKIRSMGQLPATLHTFGFGYNLRSGLLKSIAEIGGGNYGFIPDAGMIGTVFVHAVANLQSTFATRAELKLRYSSSLQIEETMGASVDQQPPHTLNNSAVELTLSLGNLQFGQSRDIFLRVKNLELLKNGSIDEMPNAIIKATLTYTKPTDIGSRGKAKPVTSTVGRSILEHTGLQADEIAYHESRSQICSFIASLFPIGPDGEHRWNDSMLTEKKEELVQLISSLPSTPFADDKNNSLKRDLAAPEPEGQISLAVESDASFSKWGCHFLPSLLNAHTRQICNSFKDPGPLQYGVDSPLFKSCRDALDNAFDNLPAPEPSRNVGPARYMGGGHGQRGGATHVAPRTYSSIKMSSYNNSRGVCFAGSTPISLASGRKVEIRKLRRGMKVRTPIGSRRVAMILRTPVQAEVLCRVGSVLVTPWHPVSTNGKTWAFPANAANGAVLYTGSIYSVLLERDRNSTAHAMRVGDIWGVTLGHGVVSGSDSRAHSFFGDYNAILKSLMTLERRKSGIVLGGGVARDEASGLVTGFKGPEKVNV